MDYKKLLKKAQKELPDSVEEKSRFEIPKVKGHIEGNKTIISNFSNIVSSLERDQNHFIKYLLKELASPGIIRGASLILNRKIAASNINDKIKKYVHEFILCDSCGKPDTKLVKEKNATYLHCQACGAKSIVKS